MILAPHNRVRGIPKRSLPRFPRSRWSCSTTSTGVGAVTDPGAVRQKIESSFLNGRQKLAKRSNTAGTDADGGMISSGRAGGGEHPNGAPQATSPDVLGDFAAD